MITFKDFLKLFLFWVVEESWPLLRRLHHRVIQLLYKRFCTHSTVHVRLGPHRVVLVVDNLRTAHDVEIPHHVLLNICQSGDLAEISCSEKKNHTVVITASHEKKIHLTPDSDRTFMMMIWRKVGFFLQFLRLYYGCVQTNMDLTLNKEIVNKCISFHDIYFCIYNIYFFTVGLFFPLVKRVPRLNTVFKPDTSEMLTHELTHQSSAPTSTN